MRKLSKTFLGIILVSFSLFFSLNSDILAQTEYPSKPITYIIGYPPGGGTDIMGRVLATALEKVLKQPVIISNKPGASGSLSMALLAQAKPDGYTIAMATSTATIFLPLVQKVAYDPVNDFTYIAQVANYAAALVVRADAPWKNFGELVVYAKQNSGKVKYGQGGPNQPATLVMEAIGKELGIKWESVPFTGEPDQLAAVLGGHITAATSVSIYPPQVRAGALRIMALMSGKRWPEFPEAPTLKDLGYNYVVEGMMGIAAPKGLPEPIRMKLEEAFAKTVKEPSFQEVIKKIAMFEEYKNGKEFARFVAETLNFNKELIRKVGFGEGTPK